LNYNLTEKSSKGSAFAKSSSRVIQKSDDRVMLYPNIDIAKPNYHGNMTVIKKPLNKPKKIESPIKEIVIK
jgi:hypothetical protein